MSTTAPTAPLRFGRFELQPRECRLLVDGRPAVIGARAFDVLLALATRAGRLVSKRELMDLVWPGRVVEENNLAAQVSALRKVLGGDVIATVPGRGYRFVTPVEPLLPDPVRAAPPGLDVTPLQATPRLRTNLPLAPPALLGRDDDLRACGALLEAHRLVTIVGAGGIGKSLLATHLLGERTGCYPQGVCWLELASVADAAALPGAVVAALDVDAGRGGDPMAALAKAVAPLEMLLALDNAEHLLADVAALCRTLLDAAPRLRIVVTSQAPLKISGERVYRIGPLAVPEGTVPKEEVMRFGAVALFVERAQAADARFALADDDCAVLIDICRKLDGLPLAIELAAARASLLGLQQLRTSMHERFRLLTASHDRFAPARQRTLRATLEWSHDLLGDREKQVFRQLGVVAGSASLDLVQGLLTGDGRAVDGQDPWAVLDALDALVERSLVVVVSRDDGATPRYRLLESTRALALEYLDAAGERPGLQRRHARAVGQLFGAAYDSYFNGCIGADAWRSELEPDLDNARDAIAVARGAGDAELELLIGATLLRALPPSLHDERTALADGCASTVSASAAAMLPEPLQLRVWLELSCAWADVQKRRARDAAGQALQLARRCDRPGGDRFPLYHALVRAASAAAQTDDLNAARALLGEARAIEDARWPAHRRLWGAEAAQWVARIGGDAGEVLQRGRELVALDRERGSEASTGLGNLVDAELAAGDVQAAVRSGEELVARLIGSRHEYSLAFARINLAAACLAAGSCAQARCVLAASWATAPAFELAHVAACYLALLAALEGRLPAAARLRGYAEAGYRARQELREGNEAAALAKVDALAREALGEGAYADALAEGAALRISDIAALAFA